MPMLLQIEQLLQHQEHNIQVLLFFLHPMDSINFSPKTMLKFQMPQKRHPIETIPKAAHITSKLYINHQQFNPNHKAINKHKTLHIMITRVSKKERKKNKKNDKTKKFVHTQAGTKGNNEYP